MLLKKLKLKNIRSYEEEEFSFREGISLLSGEIGAGKTTILLAIEYALFGLQPGQKGSALLRNNADTGEVLLEFEVDGKEVKIERRLKRENNSVVNEYASITFEGRKIESSVTEIKTKILELLSYPSDFLKKNNILFRYTVYTPQESMKQIIFEDPQSRLNIIRHIFGIEKYKLIRENLELLIFYLKENSKSLQQEIKSLPEDTNEISKLNAAISYLKENISAKEAELKLKIEEKKAIESDLDALNEKLKEKEKFEKEIEKTNLMISTKKAEIFSLSNEIKELEKFFNDFKEPPPKEFYNNLLSSIDNKKNQLNSLKSRLFEIDNSIQNAKKNILSNEEKKERIFKIVICPSCLQNVPEAHKYNILNSLEKEISSYNQSIKDLSIEKESLALSINSLEKEIASLEDEKMSLAINYSKLSEVEKKRDKYNSLKKLRESLEKDKELLHKHLTDLKKLALEYSCYNNHKKIKQEELQKTILSERSLEIALAETKKELEMKKEEIKLLNEKIKEKESKKEKYILNNEMIDWLSNSFSELLELIEKNLLFKLRREFSGLFEQLFKKLVNDKSLEVRLDENFTPIFLHNDVEMDYSFLSGGERTAVALSYRLALNETINSVFSQIKTKGLIVLDEPTEGFSESQLEKLNEIFRELHTSQLIIVSHQQKIERIVDNIIRIKKENSTSFQDN